MGRKIEVKGMIKGIEKNFFPKIGVMGLGHVGLPLAVAFASVGYKVIGCDINREIIEQLKKGKTPFYEPGLDEKLKQNLHQIIFTNNHKYTVNNSNAIFVTVGVPVDNKSNKPIYAPLDNCLAVIGKNLKKGDLIVLKSTVPPGTTQYYVIKKLEELSGLKVSRDFYVAFSPERIIEGLAFYELSTLPKIIGGVDPISAEKAAKILSRLGGKIIKVSSPTVAEIAKLCDNVYRAMNIALSNSIGEICEKLNIDAYEVINSVNAAYPRTNMFIPGLGAEGPCLPKDVKMLIHCMKQLSLNFNLIESCERINQRSTLRIGKIVLKYLKETRIRNPVVSLIGLAFKGFPETDDLRGSPSIKIYDFLKSKVKNIQIKGYDPIIAKMSQSTISRQFLKKLDIQLCKSFKECIKEADIIILLSSHPSLQNIESNELLYGDKASKKLLIIDCWHSIYNSDFLKNKNSIKYIRIGAGVV